MWRIYFVPKRTYYVPRRPYAQPYHSREEEASRNIYYDKAARFLPPNYPTFNIPTCPSSLQAVQQPFQ